MMQGENSRSRLRAIAALGSLVVLGVPGALAESPAALGVVGASLLGQQTSPLSRDNRGQSQRLEVRDLDIGELESSYRGILKRLARGDREGALEALVDFERTTIEPGPNRTSETVWKAQAEVMRSLAGKDPESLVPILMLHHDAMGRYRERRLWHLAGHSGKLAGVLAEFYAADGRTRGSQVVAARALASLGGFLQQDMSTDSCRCIPFYERARKFDPGSEAALMGTAMVHEKAGDYIQATRFLEQLLEAHPRNEEGKLRLAINNVRSGRLRLGETMLAELVAEGKEPWVVNLAFQELARIQLDRELFDRAVKILDQAVERFPDSQTLTIQRALALERTRQQRQATEILATLRSGNETRESTANYEEMTPRRRYNRWPEAVMAETREALWEGAESRISVLASALASAGQGGG